MLKGCFENPSVFFYIGKIRHRIFGCNKKQILKLGFINIKIRGILINSKIRQKAVCNITRSFRQQIRRILIMKIKRRAVHLGFFTDFLDRNILEILFLKQFNQSLIHSDCRIKVFTLVSVHRKLPYKLIFAYFLCKLNNFKCILLLTLF